MNPQPLLDAPGVDAEDLQRCIETLEALGRDPGLLGAFPREARAALLKAAGRLARPSPAERSRIKKFERLLAKQKQEASDRENRAVTEIRAARQAPVYVPPPRRTDPGPERILEKSRFCYVCKAEYRRLHFFYDAMCPDCAEFNYAKRFQTSSLAGRTALITGARLKIGYQASLMMLRAGARVLATTRFPHDAALRYSREPDFASWKERLQVYGLDLRHSPSVEIFTRFVNQTEPRLDLLVNNAAQTVRRPPAFYSHLLETEALPWNRLPDEARPLLLGREELNAALEGRPLPKLDNADSTGLAAWQQTGGTGVGLRQSAALSQLKYNYDESELAGDVFPAGETDADLQQVDLRAKNSWRLALAEVPTAEMIELQLINSVAPFILCAKLKALMAKDPTGEKHIVNVSAMEGSFSRHTKTDKHPHTNMAKAALNMLTLTSAPDYAKTGIFMNAVDTGWVTDEDPAVHSSRKREEHDFQPPLDIVDGAARVCDPFFSGLLTGSHLHGKFFKDYKPTAW
ncbi:MAG: SDR family oxidoreductase [Elusimicrobia bacterium]|nr:SDR family oxidoreductase [Elusimicrobiota bacterium]